MPGGRCSRGRPRTSDEAIEGEESELEEVCMRDEPEEEEEEDEDEEAAAVV